MTSGPDIGAPRGTELFPGEQAPVMRVEPLSLTDIVRYAGTSGDFNPMHHDSELARSRGHPDVFVMGMLPGAILAEFAASWLAPLRVRRLRLRFADRVWTHEVLDCGGEIVDVKAGPVREVTAKLWVCAAGGEVKVTGSCTAAESG